MKYKFSIVAPHPDDEFIGCRKFIQTYHNYIDHIIFVTNGERSLTHIPDMVSYINIRRLESSTWLENINENIDIHYLNIPDGVDITENNFWGHNIFEIINRQSLFSVAREKLQKIVGDNIIVMPNIEKHPSHRVSFNLCEMLSNKKIYYLIHGLLIKKTSKKPGVHYGKVNMFKQKYFSYAYVYDDKELIEKRQEFQLYYFSQYESFLKTGLKITNWEHYLSSTCLSFTNEDNVYPIKEGNF